MLIIRAPSLQQAGIESTYFLFLMIEASQKNHFLCLTRTKYLKLVLGENILRQGKRNKVTLYSADINRALRGITPVTKEQTFKKWRLREDSNPQPAD